MTSPSSQPPVPDAKDSKAKTAELVSTNSSGSGTEVSQGLQKSITDFEGFVKLVAENLRYGSWTKRLTTIAAVAAVALNPISAGKVVEAFGVKELPKWYVTLFWAGLGGIGAGTVGLAIATLPKQQNSNTDPNENKSGAIKGLLSFELQDAEIYSQLQRRWSIKECWTSITSPDFRLGILMGESGCGKSSLLKAGLLPRLLEDAAEYHGVYVKFGEQPPMNAIRKALGNLAVDTKGDDLLEILEKAFQTTGKPIVLLFDQFEQFFVQHKQQEERVAFIRSLKRWYDSELPVRVLIGIRGDLADRLTEIQKVLGYSLGPREVFRLEKFSPSEATAVLKVMAQTEGLSFDERFITDLTQNELANREDGQISPVDVQVLGWMIARQSDEELRAFDQKAFQRLGGVEGLLQRFLERTLNKRVGQIQRDLTLKVLLALTDRERNVRAGTLSLEELQNKLKGSGTAVEITEAANWLARSDVRLVATIDRASGRGYELAHERLILALLRVAKQELSEREQANQLLDRRVNEWLGNGKSKRYLFSWKELKLLQRYRNQEAIVWGAQRQWKEQLLLLSQQQLHSRLGIIAVPFAITLLFIGWSRSTPGTIQWTRWELIRMNRQENIIFPIEDPLEENFISMESALTADLVTGSKNNPLPGLWIRWFSQEGYFYKNLSDVIQISKSLDNQAARQLTGQIYQVAESSKRSANASIYASAGAQAMADVSIAYVNLEEDSKAREALARALDLAELVEDEGNRVSALQAISEAATSLRKSSEAKEILDNALHLSEEIESDWHKALALASIANDYTTLEEISKAQKILEQPLTLVERIEYEGAKVTILAAVAEAHIGLKEVSEAQNLLTKALRLTESIEYGSNKTRALEEIIEVHVLFEKDLKAQQFLDEILNLAERIEKDGDKVDMLKAVTEAAGNLEEASVAQDSLGKILNLIKSMENDGDKVDMLKAVTEAAGKLEEAPIAQDFLDEIFNLVKSIENDGDKVDILKAIIETTGNLEKASQTQKALFQALKITESIEKERDKTRALKVIAETAGNLEEASTAQEILFQSLKLNESTEDGWRQVSTLNSIAGSAGKLKEIRKGQETLAQTLSFVPSLEGTWHQAHALAAIAKNYAISGKVSKTRELLTQALTLAKSIESEGGEAHALAAISESYAISGEVSKAQEVLVQALELVDSIENEGGKVRAFMAISEAASNIENSPTAEESLDQILKAVESIEDRWTKIRTIREIAESYIEKEDTLKAKRVLQQSYHLKPSCALSEAFSLVNEFGRAFQSAQQCPIFDHQKARALATILTIHAESINPELKKLREPPAEAGSRNLSSF